MGAANRKSLQKARGIAKSAEKQQAEQGTEQAITVGAHRGETCQRKMM
jgi:hypothetical protein